MENTILEIVKESGLDPVVTKIKDPENNISKLTEWKDTWKVRNPVDSCHERPETQYLVDRIFKLPSLNIVYGYPACLKTLILEDLSICVAAGIDWLSPLSNQTEAKPKKVLQGPVFWLDVDCGLDAKDEHIQALIKARDLDPEKVPFYYSSFPSEGFNPKNKTHLQNMINRCTYYGAKLIVIDNLGNISVGADENSNQMVPILAGLRKLTEYTGAVTTAIHHQTKSDGIGRKGNRLRGHSSIEAALDLALLVNREGNSEKITIESTKSRRLPVEPFSALFTYDQKPNGDLKTARFFGLGVDQDTATLSMRREIKNVLGDGSMKKTALANTVNEILPKISVNRIRDEIDVMSLKGLIRMDPGERGAKICSLV